MSIPYEDNEKKIIKRKQYLYHHIIPHVQSYSKYFTNHDKRRWQQRRHWAGWLWYTKIGKTRFKKRNTDKLTIKTYNIFQRYLIAIIIYLAPIIWWHVLYHVRRRPHRTRVMVGNLSLYIATIYTIYIIHIMHSIIYIYTCIVYSIIQLAVHSVNADVYLFLRQAHYIIIKYIIGSYI